MMRKDVKIGLAIGSVLLAVLIVYLLATSPTHGPGEVTLVPDSTKPTDRNTLPEPLEGAAGSAAVAPVERDADDPFAPVAENSDSGATPASNDAASASTEDRWQRALNTGRIEADNVPLLLSETPARGAAGQADANSTAPEIDASRADATPAAPTSPDTSATADSPTTPVDAGPAPDAAPSGDVPVTATAGASLGAAAPSGDAQSSTPRTHIIQPGETFASIAAVIYGNSAYYPHIMRANPSIDPKRLRPGTTIVLPPASEVLARNSAQPAGAQLGGAAPDATPLDSTRQYRVQSGDSLHKIAVRLYGRADKLDAIYELNKDTIGPNRSHLKVGMILNLPEPPKSATASGQ